MRIELPASNRVRALTAMALVIPAFFVFMPPIAQDETYHFFADSRTIWSVPNFWNVASNLPFAMVGILGLWRLRSLVDRVLFAGVLLTFFGSSYYHLAPGDARLVWDRLPMTLVFMALLAGVIKTNNRLLAMFLICGITSVLWWNISGDLRFYVLVQFGPLLILVPALWFVRDARYRSGALVFYALAKLAEFYDQAVFSRLPVSGHTIKHVLAALATYFIYLWRRAAAVNAAAAALA